MATESTPDLKAEIGHVLFVDLVGYSKLLINQQSELLENLKTSSATRRRSGWLKRKEN